MHRLAAAYTRPVQAAPPRPSTVPFPRGRAAPIHMRRSSIISFKSRITRGPCHGLYSQSELAAGWLPPHELQSRFDNLRRPPSRSSSPWPSPPESEWPEVICLCIRTKIISKAKDGCQQLEGQLARCAQLTGRVQEVINKMDLDGCPPLAYALASGSKEAVQSLLNHGADPNATAHRLPVLAYAIMSRDDRLVQLLLSYGADPYTVPTRLFMTAEVAGNSDSLSEQQQAAGSKQRSAMPGGDQLDRFLNHAMRYWLYEATRLPALTAATQRAFSGLRLKSLPALRLMLVGQEAALAAVLFAITSHLLAPPGLAPKRTPLTILFAGPPGHGKTLLAEELGRLVGAPCLFIDCTTTKRVTDMFGCQNPYQGSEDGSALVNFLDTHAGKRCVVVLDEFEKTHNNNNNNEVHNGFLRVLDDGEVLDRRSGKGRMIDCSNAIFVMTTNVHDPEIIDAQKKYPSLHHARNLDPAALQRLVRPLEPKLNAGNKHHFKPSLASRIAHTIPFIPFNEREAAVVVSQTLSRFRMSVSCPALAEEPHTPGSLTMIIEEEFKICKRWAEHYSPDAGARALDREVRNRLWEQVSQLWLSEDLYPGSRFTLKPDPLEEEPFLLDLSRE